MTCLGSPTNIWRGAVLFGRSIGKPEMATSFKESIVPSYRICMRDERRVDLKAIVIILPRNNHFMIIIFLVWKPSLSIQLISLLLGINSVERKKSEKKTSSNDVLK